MTELNPYEQLGVTENASFEEIQNAKQNLKEKYHNDPPIMESIEIAYDAIIMQRLKLRQEGKIKVPEQIRFPEKTTEIKKPSLISNNPNSQKVSLWLGNLLDQPSRQEISLSGIVFFLLIAISIFNNNYEILPLLLTVGVGTSFYILYRKQKRFWRSVAITFITFIISVCIANILFNLSISTGLNISLGSEQFATLFTFCFLWLVCNFVK
ncbi:CPP1-like family protein [Geminocystis sp. GBBB08]|uniref:CPP1-like family protein n=1 Tax=Geminocystis sp. GBBB08 TaxID=2604140 RepID=UPI0027E39CCD|nr:CPP1-like family protein [Geminocystis sp. GBBB08]MBL1211017.1 molecular chaperone DnaJ [Geminocystis sp. GBBB08]